MTDFKLLIDGALVDGEAQLDVINPATEEVLVTCPRASVGQLNAAVEAANRAFATWQKQPVKARQEGIARLADALRDNADDLARLLTQEQGKPLPEARAEVGYAEAFLRYYTTLDLPVTVLQDDQDKLVELHRKPLGVVAGITPWNFPLLIAAWKLAPAVLTGNTFILKPAPTTPLTSLRLGEFCKDIFPAGVVNVIVDDNDLGAVLTAHPDIAKVSFTGSTATGKKVMESSASTLKRLTLELGGNDAAIVLDDIEPPKVAKQIFGAAFMNCGQVCLAIKRLYVHESIYDDMCNELARLAEEAVVDDGLKQGTRIGPLQNKQQFEKVKRFLESAKKDGTIIAGGEVLDRSGYFLAPTIVRDIEDGTQLVDEEPFGPILPVIKFEDVENVISRANNSDYGLGGSVWSSDLERARDIAQRMDCGTVWINQHLDFGPAYPFGGAKQSGIGVEFSTEGLYEFTQIQVLNMARPAPQAAE